MPIGNISPAGKDFKGAAEYDLAQGRYAEQEAEKQPEIIEQNLVIGNDAGEIAEQMRDLAKENDRVKSPVMKFSISFDPKENLSDAQKKEFTKKVMKEMGIKQDNHQYLITRHSDKGHDHHHVLANRVGLDAKVIDYSHSVPRLEKAIDKVEKEMGLDNKLASTRRFVYDPTQEKGYKVQKENFKSNREKVSTRNKSKGIEQKKNYLKEQVPAVLNRSYNLYNLKENLEEKNIDAQYRFDKQGKLTGVSFKYQDYSLKGSALGKEFKASSIEKGFEKNKERLINTINFDRLAEQAKAQASKLQTENEYSKFDRKREELKAKQQQNQLQNREQKREELKQEPKPKHEEKFTLQEELKYGYDLKMKHNFIGHSIQQKNDEQVRKMVDWAAEEVGKQHNLSPKQVEILKSSDIAKEEYQRLIKHREHLNEIDRSRGQKRGFGRG